MLFRSGCAGIDSAQVYVKALPIVTLPAYPGRCMKEGPFPLFGATPAGGIYYGTRVVNDTFYSQIRYNGAAFPGTSVKDTVRYIYTDTVTGCTNRAYSTIEIFPTPTVAITPSDTTIYMNESVVLDAGNPGCSYFWKIGRAHV